MIILKNIKKEDKYHHDHGNRYIKRSSTMIIMRNTRTEHRDLRDHKEEKHYHNHKKEKCQHITTITRKRNITISPSQQNK
jgi:hypothetical protein